MKKIALLEIEILDTSGRTCRRGFWGDPLIVFIDIHDETRDVDLRDQAAALIESGRTESTMSYEVCCTYVKFGNVIQTRRQCPVRIRVIAREPCADDHAENRHAGTRIAVEVPRLPARNCERTYWGSPFFLLLEVDGELREVDLSERIEEMLAAGISESTQVHSVYATTMENRGRLYEDYAVRLLVIPDPPPAADEGSGRTTIAGSEQIGSGDEDSRK